MKQSRLSVTATDGIDGDVTVTAVRNLRSELLRYIGDLDVLQSVIGSKTASHFVIPRQMYKLHLTSL